MTSRMNYQQYDKCINKKAGTHAFIYTGAGLAGRQERFVQSHRHDELPEALRARAQTHLQAHGKTRRASRQ